jgi:hypothetical protein
MRLNILRIDFGSKDFWSKEQRFLDKGLLEQRFLDQGAMTFRVKTFGQKMKDAFSLFLSFVQNPCSLIPKSLIKKIFDFFLTSCNQLKFLRSPIYKLNNRAFFERT